ncbi:hypothetical protein PSPO01_16109 [Paraphaeosphaeria sporulosa]
MEPDVYGLCVEACVFWRTLNNSWRNIRGSIALVAVIAITLQLVGFSGVVAAEERMPPPFLGSLLFHVSATLVFLYLLWRFSNVRHPKVIAVASCFAFALSGDVISLYCVLRPKGFGAYSPPHAALYLVDLYPESPSYIFSTPYSSPTDHRDFVSRNLRRKYTVHRLCIGSQHERALSSEYKQTPEPPVYLATPPPAYLVSTPADKLDASTLPATAIVKIIEFTSLRVRPHVSFTEPEVQTILNFIKERFNCDLGDVSALGIQFGRIGTDVAAREALEGLDDELRLEQDIVDNVLYFATFYLSKLL